MATAAAGKLDERYAFVVEWFDQSAQQAKEFRLFYYADDNSVEMYDPKQRRTFLKRSKYPSIHLEDFFIGSAVNVFSRQLIIKAFADEITQQKIAQKVEQAIVMVKPSKVSSMGKIIEDLYLNKFSISRLRMIEMSREHASRFAQIDRQKPLDSVNDFVGKCVVLEVAKNNAVSDLRTVLNGQIWQSQTAASAEKEIEFFFGPNAGQLFPRTAQFKNSTLAIIKPHVLNKALKTGAPGKIIDGILKAGFMITDAQLFHLDRVNAEEFYEVYKTVVPEFHLMVDELISGPCIALEVADVSSSAGEGEPIVSKFRQFVGPFDPEIGTRIRPDSLRAQFGEDKVKNAIHCTDLSEDGELEVQYFFQILVL